MIDNQARQRIAKLERDVRDQLSTIQNQSILIATLFVELARHTGDSRLSQYEHQLEQMEAIKQQTDDQLRKLK